MKNLALNNIPTVELHRHFEAGMSPETIATLAERNGITDMKTREGAIIPGVDPQNPDSVRAYFSGITHGFKGPGGFSRFLDSFGILSGIMKRHEDLSFAAFEQIKEQAKDGSLHTELRGSPFSYMANIGGRLEEIILAIKDGVDRAYEELGLSGAVIACFSRQKGLNPGGDPVTDQGRYVVGSVLRVFDQENPIGIDIAGAPESKFPPAIFERIMAPAKEAGIPITVHAGEQGKPKTFSDAPAKYVIDAVQLLGAKRIGHATSAAVDDDAVSIMREQKIVVEACPVSNAFMGFLDRAGSYPMEVFMRRGVKLTISTDDPLMFGISSVREMIEKYGEELRIRPESLIEMTENAIEGAFVSEGRRGELMRQFNEATGRSFHNGR